jgi:hypothetical protein
MAINRILWSFFYFEKGAKPLSQDVHVLQEPQNATLQFILREYLVNHLTGLWLKPKRQSTFKKLREIHRKFTGIFYSEGYT